MTPGLADFVASGDSPQSWQHCVDAALAALAAQFTVAAELGGAPAAPRRSTWFDTFDWRLHRAGLTLQYLTRRRGGELILSGADGGVAQRLTGWQPARPHLLRDLPDGPVTDRIARLVAPRALLPVVTVSTATATRRLLNADGKTVARLLIEHQCLAGANPAGLPPRLTIAEIRGYPGAARRAARAVAAVPGMREAAESAFTAALRAFGRYPGDYSNKVDADITAAMPAPAAAATILLRLLDTVEANVDGVLKDTDTEFLHDLRVSVRRTRSALKLFGDTLTVPAAGKDGAALTAEELAFFAAEFKWVGDLTTPTRDLDVHLLDFEVVARSLAAAKPDDLEPFRGYLEQRRRRELRALARGLRSPRFTDLTRNWRVRLAAIQRDATAAATAGTVRSGKVGTAGALAAARGRAAFAKVERRGAAITADSPAEALHDLRKRCKELRYALEFFAPLYPPAACAKVVGDLKRLQDCLGEFQDTAVQIAEIRTLAVAMLAAGEAPAVTLLAMGEVTAGLAGRQRAARADFGRRFTAFADAAGQRRISALLRGRRVPAVTGESRSPG